VLDPKLLKESPGTIREMLQKRKADFPLDELVSLDRRRRELIVETQKVKHDKNTITNTIALLKKAGRSAEGELQKMKDVSKRIEELQQEQNQVEAKFHDLAMLAPNLLDESVPIGNDEKDNKIIREFGTITKPAFTPKDHVDIATALDLVDIERAAKISGSRFYFLKNKLVMLNQALIRFALDFLSQKGYTLLQPPFMIRKEAMEGAVIMGDFADVIYKVEGEDLYMIGTSEHALAAMHKDEILDGKTLPIRYAGFSPCFRKEAGAHGKDMKGIFRVHQFEKVEQFVFSRPEDSRQEHERMIENSESFFQSLGIPHRVVLLCSADTGKVSAKTYDIEAWMAGQGAYREVVSCSNCLDYQARRLSIRFRDKTNEETKLVHTLNGTLVATERTIVAILENYQTAKGTVEVPQVLQKYMGDQKEISLQ
jgi:seryl-tRNA synthetase